MWKPHGTVACVIEQDGKFLFVEEMSHGEKVINQPAGHLEDGETIIEGALREVMEETAWEVEITDFLGFYVYRPPQSDSTYHRYCFIAKPIRKIENLPLDADIIQTHWLSYDELISGAYNMRSSLVRSAVEDYVAGKRYPLSIIHEPDIN